MKTFMTTTSLASVLLAASSAIASSDVTMLFKGEATGLEISASDMIGMRVYAAEGGSATMENAGIGDGWEDVGEINDLILTREGGVEAVLVDLGGFLGIGERQVAMNMTTIQMVADTGTEDPDDFFLVIPASRANLEEAPAWAPMGTDAPVAETATGSDATVTTEEEPAQADMAEAAEQVESTEAEVAEGAEPVPGPWMDRDGFALAKAEDLTTEDLTGARVYDSNDEWIGEISELTVNDGGQIERAIVDVGGFLGLGEKPVALGMQELNIIRAEGGGEVRVYVPMSEEQLEALPTYEG